MQDELGTLSPIIADAPDDRTSTVSAETAQSGPTPTAVESDQSHPGRTRVSTRLLPTSSDTFGGQVPARARPVGPPVPRNGWIHCYADISDYESIRVRGTSIH